MCIPSLSLKLQDDCDVLRVFWCVCEQLLSSKGTVLCLLCVSLVPLQQVDYDRFLLLLPAMCHVLHAVLIHHPHTTIRVLEDCLALVSCILSLTPAIE